MLETATGTGSGYLDRILAEQAAELAGAEVQRAAQAAFLIERCIEDHPGKSLYASEQFGAVVMAIIHDDSEKSGQRLATLLNALGPYAQHAGKQTANTRHISVAGQAKAAELVRKAADAIGQGLEYPKWDLRREQAELGPCTQAGIEQLARNGTLSLALRYIASSIEAADFHAFPPIPGMDQGAVAKNRLSDPDRKVPGYLARNIFSALPAGFENPYATIAALLWHIGINVEPHTVARYVKG